MDRLSSCYFCGAALDASLSEYPIVPKQLQPDDHQQQTVVLCQTCRRKLGKVVETVTGAVDQPSGGTDGDPTEVERETVSDEESGAPDERASDETDAGWVSAEEVVRDDAGGEQPRRADADARSEPGREEPVAGGEPDDAEPNPRSGRRRPKDAAAESGPRSGGDPLDDPEQSAGGAERAPSGTPSRNGDGGGADVRRNGSTDPGQADVGGDGTRAQSNGTAASEGDDGPSLTRLEYNKVMRLLQNRDFPVDKGEIRAVATNAYQISDAEFDRIIDAAVERGLIDERDGQFVQGS